MIEKPFSIYYIKQQLWRIPHIQWWYRGDRLRIDLCQRLRRLWTHTGRLCLVSTVPNLVLNSDPHMLGWNQHGSKSVCNFLMGVTRCKQRITKDFSHLYVRICSDLVHQWSSVWIGACDNAFQSSSEFLWVPGCSTNYLRHKLILKIVG